MTEVRTVLTERLPRVVAIISLGAAAVLTTSCSNESDIFESKFCKVWHMGPQSGGMAEDIRDKLHTLEKKGKVPDDLEGLHGLQSAANDISEILLEKRDDLGSKAYTHGLSAGDQYQLCLNTDGLLDAGDPAKMIPVELL